MKKVLLSLGVVAALAMTSCGGVDACSCMEMGLEMSKEMKEAKGDEAKMKEIEEKYKSDIEACDELGKEQAKMSEEEQKAAMKDLEENCDAYKEMQKEMGM